MRFGPREQWARGYVEKSGKDKLRADRYRQRAHYGRQNRQIVLNATVRAVLGVVSRHMVLLIHGQAACLCRRFGMMTMLGMVGVCHRVASVDRVVVSLQRGEKRFGKCRGERSEQHGT